MKTRNDFVSNSSSSSFIVISTDGKDETAVIKTEFQTDDFGWYEIPNCVHKHQFGWENEMTCDFGGKLNFIGIQLLSILCVALNRKTHPKCSPYYSGNPETDFERFYSMLRKVCKDKFNIEIRLNSHLMYPTGLEDFDIWFGFSSETYIDHQSSAEESCCMEMFKSEDALYDFLRTRDSYIQGGNDNE